MLTRPFGSSMLIPLISLSLRSECEAVFYNKAAGRILNEAELFMISQSWHNCWKGSSGERSCFYVVFCVMKEQISPFARQKRAGVGAIRDMGGSRARLLSNFAAFIQAVKSNNQEIMQPWFVNYERVKRCTEGNDRRHLSPAASAVWLYHQRGNITFWCLHKRSISISQKCNSFQPSLSQGIDSPKNIQWFFKANKTKKRQQKSILADLLSISNIASCIFFGGNPLRMQSK